MVDQIQAYGYGGSNSSIRIWWIEFKHTDMVDRTTLYKHEGSRQPKTSQVNQLDHNQACCLEWIKIL